MTKTEATQTSEAKIELDAKVSNIFTDNLPADPEKRNFTRPVYKACYSETYPSKTSDPKMIHFNEVLAEELNLKNENRDDLLQLLSGNSNLDGFLPYSMCYGGHQFGTWAGQLGDGRAINIGEVEGKSGVQTLQLKGAGSTPYSRTADGLAVLRSSIREYLCSEAMYYLGVPTTRALSLVLTGDQVLRDIMYNGNAAYEKGAIVCRVAPSFIRFGNFEIYASVGDLETLKTLLDFTITQYFPHLGAPSKDAYLKFYAEVSGKTLDLMMHWQRVGFVHGVMNTDNMSILGLTIDYGPYGWLENFEQDWTPNTTDAGQRRYRYGNQPSIGLWNLTQLGNAIVPLIGETKPLENILGVYQDNYLVKYYEQIAAKTGLSEIDEDMKKLAVGLEALLEESEMDMTIFYRNLAKFDPADQSAFMEILKEASYAADFSPFEEKWSDWLAAYGQKIRKENADPEKRTAAMNRENPKYVLRNYMAQLAIDDADKGDYGLIEELYEMLKRPYDEQPEMEKWFAKRPDWAKNRVGCSMLSCSS
ncbi:MAG: YdiU family protein [Pyrinomonadaceae bacterium]